MNKEVVATVIGFFICVQYLHSMAYIITFRQQSCPLWEHRLLHQEKLDTLSSLKLLKPLRIVNGKSSHIVLFQCNLKLLCHFHIAGYEEVLSDVIMMIKAKENKSIQYLIGLFFNKESFNFETINALYLQQQQHSQHDRQESSSSNSFDNETRTNLQIY